MPADRHRFHGLAVSERARFVSFAVVYGVDSATGCIDAFAISMEDDPMVRIYHCR